MITQREVKESYSECIFVLPLRRLNLPLSLTTPLLPPASEGWGRLYFHFVSPHLEGGTQSQVQVGGVPGPGLGRGVPGPGLGRRVPGPGLGRGSQVQVRGGTRSQIGGGYPVSGPGGVSVKGKFFDTRFGLIHVQTGKKNFCRGTPPLPVKGKIFDT